MWVGRAAIAVCLALILGVPFLLRPEPGRQAADLPTLVIVTPHVEQIRREFGAAFSRWHGREYGAAVRIDWRTPGGTSEILKQLTAMYESALKAGRIAPDGAAAPGAVAFDLMFGGGSYEHGRLKAGVAWGGADGARVSMSVPAGFSREQLEAWYGENRIGSQRLYDPEQHWLGVALSGFGIVYNREVLARLGVPEPRSFADLTDPRLAGWVALADPRQSGSVATAFDSVLNNEGWERGWRILREMCANTRYFTNSSTRPPIDVSAGEAAAGLAIDFYGRGQAGAVMREGETPETSRVGYIDPPGKAFIDADPVSILRGGPNPALARRFVEFCLTEEGQALWQFPAREQGAAGPAAWGPERYELRRLPARRVMYEKYVDRFVDRVNPFEIASDVSPRGWRGAIGVMMGAFAIDIADEQREAWRALIRARRDPGFPSETLAAMERLFYAWPETELPDGRIVPFTEANIGAILEAWRAPGVMPGARIRYTAFFRANDREVARLARSPGARS